MLHAGGAQAHQNNKQKWNINFQLLFYNLGLNMPAL